MKTFYCKKCKFSGIRPIVRKHIREEHLIKGKRMSSEKIGRYASSKITEATGRTEDG